MYMSNFRVTPWTVVQSIIMGHIQGQTSMSMVHLEQRSQECGTAASTATTVIVFSDVMLISQLYLCNQTCRES